jgi:hypothetical protein
MPTTCADTWGRLPKGLTPVDERKIVDDTLRKAVTEALAEFPDESVARQVQAAALRIAAACAEDLARVDAAVPREARRLRDAPVAQAFFDFMRVANPNS